MIDMARNDTDPVCANCRFGIYLEGRKPGDAVVVCRRNPPVPVLAPGERHEPGDTLKGYWPRTLPDDECGEHKFHEGEFRAGESKYWLRWPAGKERTDRAAAHDRDSSWMDYRDKR